MRTWLLGAGIGAALALGACGKSAEGGNAVANDAALNSGSAATDFNSSDLNAIGDNFGDLSGNTVGSAGSNSSNSL